MKGRATIIAVLAVCIAVLLGIQVVHRSSATRVRRLSAMATESIAGNRSQPVGSVNRNGKATLVGLRSNAAYFASLVRFDDHLNGQIAISKVGPGRRVRVTAVGVVGLLRQQLFRFRVTNGALGTRTLTGRVVGRELILTTSQGNAIALRPGAVSDFNKLFGLAERRAA